MTGENDVPDENAPTKDDLATNEPAEEVSEEVIDLDADDAMNTSSTAEINVDKLIAKMDTDESARSRELRQKLDALNEQGDDEFGSTYNFNIDDEL